jgi:hypothetical protein
MTPKEKAEELVGRFEGYVADCGGFVRIMPRDIAKKSALICVDEIIETYMPKSSSSYWQQIKQEIELL